MFVSCDDPKTIKVFESAHYSASANSVLATPVAYFWLVKLPGHLVGLMTQDTSGIPSPISQHKENMKFVLQILCL